MLERDLHVVWAENVGPLVAYWNIDLAHAHARTMVGVVVATCRYAGEMPGECVFIALTPELGPARARDTGPSARAGEDVQVMRCEVRTVLPDFIVEDISQEVYGDDDGVTPIDGVIALGDIDDGDG